MNGNGAGPLLSHLPGVYHSSKDLRELLAILETVLFGPDDRGLEAQIAKIWKYFDAVKTPDEFLPWLAEWVALTYTDGLSSTRRRQLISEIVPLYATRGTKGYLAKMLEFFSPDATEITIEDHEFAGLIIGQAKIGMDSWLERDRPFWFKVKIRAPGPRTVSPQEHARSEIEWRDRARKIIDLAKPAHTTYDLDWAFNDVGRQSFEFRRRETPVGEGNDDC